MASYFSFFPSLLYGNTAVTNIIAKIKFDQSVASNLAVFYPYVIEQGERPDQVANFYYGSSEYDWVIYLSNNIVDPYHDWPKSEETLESFIKTKYGSLANAQFSTAYYRINYESDNRNISTAAYEALSKNQKKYWLPQIGYNTNILGYERKPLDLISETNKIIELKGNFSSANVVANTIIKQSSSILGTVAFANSTTINLKHISGSWINTNPIYTRTDVLIASSYDSTTTISEPIPSDELSYWTAVSYFDVEAEKNEKQKHIKLLNARYLSLIERDMKELLQV